MAPRTIEIGEAPVEVWPGRRLRIVDELVNLPKSGMRVVWYPSHAKIAFGPLARTSCYLAGPHGRIRAIFDNIADMERPKDGLGVRVIDA